MSTRPTDDEIPQEALTLLGPWGRLLLRIGPRNAQRLRGGIGAVAGGAMGLGYYLLIGCSTGSCPITSNPFTAMLYGALVGALVASR